MNDLVAIGYLMKRLGLSRTRCYQLTCRPGFPTPVGVAPGRVWHKTAVDAWISAHRPEPQKADVSIAG